MIPHPADLLLPPARRTSADDRRRATVLAIAAVASVLLCEAFAAHFVVEGYSALAATLGLAAPVAAVGVLLGVRRGLRFEAAGVLAASMVVLTQLAVARVEGTDGWALSWMLLAPILGTSIGGCRAGAAATAIALGGVAVASLAEAQGWNGSPREVSRAYQIADATALFLTVGALLVFAERSRARTEAQLGRAARRLEQEAERHRATRAHLEQTQGTLTRTARLSGMAEVATGVLHHVGNALNSVQVSASVVREQLRSPTIAQLGTHAEHLVAKASTDPELVVRWLRAAAHAERDRLEHLADEVRSLESAARVIATVISRQQEHARQGSSLGPTSLRALVDEACVLTGLDQDPLVRLVPPRDDVVISTDRNRVLGVLYHLLRNARQATEAVQDREIRVTLERVEDGARIRVADSGPGVPPLLVPRLFDQGFTTRDSGLGFGLHSSHIDAKQLGGALRLDDTSPLRGACFVLELPDAMADADVLADAAGA